MYLSKFFTVIGVFKIRFLKFIRLHTILRFTLRKIVAFQYNSLKFNVLRGKINALRL